jgi:hypothetical protein
MAKIEFFGRSDVGEDALRVPISCTTWKIWTLNACKTDSHVNCMSASREFLFWTSAPKKIFQKPLFSPFFKKKTTYQHAERKFGGGAKVRQEQVCRSYWPVVRNLDLTQNGNPQGNDRPCWENPYYVRRKRFGVQWSNHRQAQESLVSVPSHSRPHHYLPRESALPLLLRRFSPSTGDV